MGTKSLPFLQLPLPLSRLHLKRQPSNPRLSQRPRARENWVVTIRATGRAQLLQIVQKYCTHQFTLRQRRRLDLLRSHAFGRTFEITLHQKHSRSFSFPSYIPKGLAKPRQQAECRELGHRPLAKLVLQRQRTPKTPDPSSAAQRRPV